MVRTYPHWESRARALSTSKYHRLRTTLRRLVTASSQVEKQAVRNGGKDYRSVEDRCSALDQDWWDRSRPNTTTFCLEHDNATRKLQAVSPVFGSRCLIDQGLSCIYCFECLHTCGYLKSAASAHPRYVRVYVASVVGTIHKSLDQVNQSYRRA